MSDPVTPVQDPAHVPPRCAPRTQNLMVRYSRFSICHTDFRNPKSRIGNREIRNHGAVE
jgi:hypothetical protein